eukprot:11299466-Alexandrium_andersonii.AAC.1
MRWQSLQPRVISPLTVGLLAVLVGTYGGPWVHPERAVLEPRHGGGAEQTVGTGAARLFLVLVTIGLAIGPALVLALTVAVNIVLAIALALGRKRLLPHVRSCSNSAGPGPR